VSTSVAGQSQVTVMVVDDEPRVCKLFERVLREEGYRTITASSGREALALVGDAQPDLILLDIVMPGINGVETLRELRRRGLAAVVIMITAQGSLHTAREAMLLGAYDYVTKPFNLEFLKTVLRAGLSERSRRRGENECGR
jgi:DNA-binding response OmpR family regulator